MQNCLTEIILVVLVTDEYLKYTPSVYRFVHQPEGSWYRAIQTNV